MCYNKRGKQLSYLAEQTKEYVYQMSEEYVKMINEITEAMEEVAKTTESLSILALHLNEETQKFKIK